MINYIKAAWRLGWFQVPGWLSFLALQQLALWNSALTHLPPHDHDAAFMAAAVFNILIAIIEGLIWVGARPVLLQMTARLHEEAKKIEYEQAKIEAQQGQLSSMEWEDQ